MVTPSELLLEKTRDELSSRLVASERATISERAAVGGAIFVLVKDLRQAVLFANAYAPEHLLIDTDSPTKLFRQVRNAGSVFLGRYSSVAFGDYCSGTNHILPTKGMAAMKSALGVNDFVKMMPYQEISERGARTLAETVAVLARSEGLPAHADAALARRTKVGR